MSPYIQSLRLRTLPLSVAGIILGSGLAFETYPHPLLEGKGVFVFILAVLTALSLQILSNLSNELGDAQKGTDTDQHGRAAYGLQAGTITEKQMKRMIGLFIGLCVIFGTTLVWTAFCGEDQIINQQSEIINSVSFLGLGLFAILGAMTYTLGKHSYGYIGLGDLGVFIFFGLASTWGAYYLQTQTLSWDAFWCGIAIGLPCVGVLNLNNMRDMSNDRVHGKRTFASLLGPVGARVYHYLLLFCCMLIFILNGHYWIALITPVWVWHIRVVGIQPPETLDKQMPVLMFSTLIVAILAIF